MKTENKENQKYKPTGKIYEVRTIEELFAIMTKENITYLMADLFKTGEMMLAVDEMNKATCQAAGLKYEKLQLPVWQWIDDGENDLKCISISDQ